MVLLKKSGGKKVALLILYSYSRSNALLFSTFVSTVSSRGGGGARRMIGSHSSISAGGTGVGPPSAPSGGVHGNHGDEGGGSRGIYIISDSSLNLGGQTTQSSRRTNTGTISTASESLEMMTTASSSSYSRGSRPAVPRSYSDVIPEDVRGVQLPGAIPEVSSDVSTNQKLC